MLWLAVAATLAASTPARTAPAPVVAQASATVRVISGIRLKLDSATNNGAPQAHNGTVTSNGTQQRARLIEFQ
jgi:hypothetical protein